MNRNELKNIIEAVLLAAGRPMTVDQILDVFDIKDRPTRDEARAVLDRLSEDYEKRGIEIIKVASGYRVQVRKELAPWVSRLWDEKPGRYTRALLETLALIAYRQPITRGEIEDVRGVSVSTNIIRTLLEREWVKVLGYRDVPGKPAMYGTTRQFLDYFNLKSLSGLPSLQELRDIEQINAELDFSGDGDSNGESPAAVVAIADDQDKDTQDEVLH